MPANSRPRSRSVSLIAGSSGAPGAILARGDEMAELGELDQNVGGVGAGVMEGAHQLERLGDLALHRVLEQRDDLAPVGEAEHVANGERA